jgi:hypothetical protein
MNKEQERILRSVIATMEIEGFDITEENVNNLKLVISGEVACEDMIQMLKLKHRQKNLKK